MAKMLPLKNFVILFAAGAIATTKPVERQSPPILRVTLSNSASAVMEEYNASTDSTVVSVASTTAYDTINLGCLEVCIPEYHCTLYDKSLAAIMDVNPGTTNLSNIEVGQVTCASNLVTTPDRRSTRRRRQWSYRNAFRDKYKAGVVPRQTDGAATYDGEAIFTDAATGAQTKVGFLVGQNTTLGSASQNMSAATVEQGSLTTSDTSQAFTCVAYNMQSTSMGTFFGTERYSYSFAPGVVGSFLCSTGT